MRKQNQSRLGTAKVDTTGGLSGFKVVHTMSIRVETVSKFGRSSRSSSGVSLSAKDLRDIRVLAVKRLRGC